MIALIGCFLGTIVGLLPGLGPINGVAILMPLAFALKLPPETALILRHGLDVEVMRIPSAAGTFIGALRNGSTLGDAVQAAGRDDAEFDLAVPLGLLLQKGAVAALVP